MREDQRSGDRHENRAREPGTRDIPTVAVLPGTSGPERDRCLGLGVEGFVAKPIDPVAFRAEIGRVLAGRKGRKASPARPA